MRKWRNKFIICLMIVFVFLSGIFYINRKSIGNVLDYLYFIRVVETNSFRLNTIPTLDTKQIYLNKIMNCKNDREFLNDLIEFYFNYETKGHFNIVDVDSYHRIHQVYKNLIQDKRISKNNWNYKKLMDKEVFDSYSKLGKDTPCLHEENDRGVDCYEDGEFFVIEFHSFDISMLNSLAQINEELQDFHGDKIIIDISDNEGGSDIVWEKLVSYLSGADYRYKSKITGHGKTSKKYVESYGIDVQGSESKFSYIDCIDIQSEKLFDFKKVYLIMGDKTFSAADSFARFSKSTGFATVIGKESAGFGTGLDPMLLKLPYTNVLVMLDSVGKYPETTKPTYQLNNIWIKDVEQYIVTNNI